MITTLRPTLVVFLGVQLSGKSTLAKIISQSIGLPYVSIDMVRQWLFGELSSPKDWKDEESRLRHNANIKKAYDHFFHVINNNLSSGQSLIVEMPHLGSRQADLVAMVERFNFDLKIIWCYISDDSDEEIQKRVAVRSLDKDMAQIRSEDYNMFKVKIQKPTLTNTLDVDTCQPLEDSIRQILDWIM